MTSHINLKAFVLDISSYGQKGRILRLLTEKRGLITAVLRNQKDDCKACTQPFTFAEFQLFDYRQRLTVDEADIIEQFSPLYEDFTRLSAANFVRSIFVDTMAPDQSDASLYKLWAYSIHEITTGKDSLLAAEVAIMRLLAIIGYDPWLGNCVVCEKDIVSDYVFDFALSGTLCNDCAVRPAERRRMTLLPGTMATLHYVCSSELNKLFKFRIKDNVRSEFLTFVKLYIEEKLEKSYKGLDFISQLADFENKNKWSDNLSGGA